MEYRELSFNILKQFLPVWCLKVKSHEQIILFLFSLRCFQLLYWNWMQRLKMLYLLLLSTLHTLYLHLLLSLYLQCQDKSLQFSRQTRRGGSQASRLLSVARHTLRQAQRHAQQAASSASKQQAQVLVYKQPAPPPLESAATSEIPPILLWL